MSIPLITWLWLVLAITLETIGTVSLKSSREFTVLVPSLIVFFAYAASFYMLVLVMRYLPVAVTYAFWSGLGTALILIAAIFIFGEKPDLAALIGIGMIIGGVVLIVGFSSMNVHI